MKFDKITGLDDERFRRLTGVKRTTFEKMTLILKDADKTKKIRGGRKNKLSIENILLKSDIEYDVILIDATETPIERPKKNKKLITQEKKKTHHKNSSGC